MILDIFEDGPVNTPVEDVAADDVVDLYGPLEKLQQDYPDSEVDYANVMTAEDMYIVVESVDHEESAVVLYTDQMNMAFPFGTSIPVVGKATDD